jgi:hypothetical protein
MISPPAFQATCPKGFGYLFSHFLFIHHLTKSPSLSIFLSAAPTRPTTRIVQLPGIPRLL